MVDILVTVLQLYFYAVLIWVILSWIPASGSHPVGRFSAMLDRIVLPVLRPLRRVIPPLRLGGGFLDLTPLVLLLVVNILIGLVRRLG